MVFPSSLLARRVFSNALLQGRPIFPVTVRNRRSLNSFSLDRRRRVMTMILSSFLAVCQHNVLKGSFSRSFSTDGVVLGLLLTNVAVFTLWKVADSQFMVKNFKMSLDHIQSGRLHTLITYAISHKDTLHLIIYMINLYFFGYSMGKKFGPQYLLKLYLAGALAGSIFYVAYQAFIAPSIYKGDPEGLAYSRLPAMGASGATTGIMLLYIFLFPKHTMFEMIIPVPAALVGIILIGKDVWGVMQGDHQIAASAHSGGATVAALAWLQKRKRRFGRF